jgi:D-alanyl-D-alanine carboxypeptidase (penicillin-binding protein 5/6)
MLNPSSKYYYRHCVSGVSSAVLDDGTTGASYEGGHSSIALAETDALSLIAVVLGSDVLLLEDSSTQRRNLTESQRLFEYGFSQFSWRSIISTEELVAKTPIVNGSGADFVILRPESEIMGLLDNDIPDNAFIRAITIFSEVNGETLYAPIEAGDVLGEVTITRNGTIIGTVRLVASTSIELHRLQNIKNQIAEVLSSTVAQIIIWVLAILVALYAALVIRYNIIRSKRKRMNMEARQKLVEERQSPNQTHGSQKTRL